MREKGAAYREDVILAKMYEDKRTIDNLNKQPQSVRSKMENKNSKEKENEEGISGIGQRNSLGSRRASMG